jgi:hypothetical protein
MCRATTEGTDVLRRGLDHLRTETLDGTTTVVLTCDHGHIVHILHIKLCPKLSKNFGTVPYSFNLIAKKSIRVVCLG